MRSPSAVLHHLRFRSFAVPRVAGGEPEGAGAPPAQAAHLLAELVRANGQHEASLYPSSVSLQYEVSAGRGARLRVPVALLAEPANGQALTVDCELYVSHQSTESTESTRAARVTLTPARGAGWSWVTARVPPSGSGGAMDLRVTLSTRIGSGGEAAPAWTAIGPMYLDRPRTVGDWRIAARTLLHKSQAIGWRRVLRQVLTRPAPETPDEDYASWAARHAPSPATLAAQRDVVAAWDKSPGAPLLVSVITPAHNSLPEWLRDCLASLEAQSYPHWQWSVADDASTDPETLQALKTLEANTRVTVAHLPENVGISRASNAAIANAKGQILVLLDHDDVLSPDALFEVVSAFRADSSLELLYSDEDKLETDGSLCEPYFKPDWSPELFMGTMYTCHLTAMRRELVERAGGFRQGFEGAQDYDLWLRMIENTSRVHHIPKVLYHWRKVPGSTAAYIGNKPDAVEAGRLAIESAVNRRGLAASVTGGLRPGHYRIRFQHEAVLTSVLMPTYGPGSIPPGYEARVSAAVASMAATTLPGQLEFVFATDDGELPAAVRQAAGAIPVRVVGVPGPFNFSARINRAAASARGSLLLVANDDLEATEDGWLDALLDYALQPGVGAVGPRLSLPDGRVQHAGVLLGVRGVAAHAFHHAAPEHEGYFGSLIGPRNMSAVTGACLLTRASAFGQVRGFDEALAQDFNDVDYCLRLSAKGLRTVVTPFARLVHHESASIGGRAPGRRAVRLMSKRWGSLIARDPFYNPNLSRDVTNYRLRP